MSPTADSIAEEQPQFTEMKPMRIQYEPTEDTQNTVSVDPDTAAKIEECKARIASIYQQMRAAEGEVAGLPEGSVSERAFERKPTRTERETTPYSEVVNEDELIEDVQENKVTIKKEPTNTKYVNPEDLVNNAISDLIHIDAVFSSFAEFDAAYRTWKDAGYHPMRIASSEALKDPSGKVDERFRYKHAVYHCAHYGKPRFRGNGARPNQSYLPCGCPAMLRLMFNYGEQVLRVSSMNMEHVGHPVTYEHYKAVCSNNRPTKRSRTSNSSTPNSSYNASPSSYTSTPYPVKQEIIEPMQIQQSTSFNSSTPTSSGLNNFDNGRQPENEEYTPKVKEARTMENAVQSSSNINEYQRYQMDQKEYEDTVINVPALPGLPKMEIGAAFRNWSEFESSFEHWKNVGMHPMRIASSETMKDLNGMPNLTYKYKYVVYHCAHYGIPRARGNGQRPNQSYLPCGCGSMLKLAYNFEDQNLRVNAMVAGHTGHPRDRKFFEKVNAKIKSSRGRYTTANFVYSPVSTPVASLNNSVAQTGTPVVGQGLDINQIYSMLTAQTQMTMQLLQQAQSQPGSINLSSILNGINRLSAIQQSNNTGIQMEQPYEGGTISKDLNADLKNL